MAKPLSQFRVGDLARLVDCAERYNGVIVKVTLVDVRKRVYHIVPQEPYPDGFHYRGGPPEFFCYFCYFHHLEMPEGPW